MKRRIVSAMALLLAVVLLCPAVQAASNDIKVRRVEISTDSITVRVNQVRTLWAYVIPVDATDDTIFWDSSNTEVVLVNADGELTGVSPGKAVVTATSQNGKAATCRVTVPGTVVTALEQDLDSADIGESQATGGEALISAVLRVDVEKAVKAAVSGTTATVSYRDKTRVSTTALRAAAYIAGYNGGACRIKAITPSGSSTLNVWGQPTNTGADQGWLLIDPGKAGEKDATIRLGVDVESNTTLALQSAAKKIFGQCAVLKLAQQGSYGMDVTVAAKVDLSGLNTEKLVLYSYDSESGNYTKLANQSCKVQNGYLYFTTGQGGYVIVASK